MGPVRGVRHAGDESASHHLWAPLTIKDEGQGAKHSPIVVVAVVVVVAGGGCRGSDPETQSDEGLSEDSAEELTAAAYMGEVPESESSDDDEETEDEEEGDSDD